MAIRGSSLPSFGGNDKFALGRDGLVLIGKPRPDAQAQPAEEPNAEVAIQFMRAGALLIVVFQGLFFAMHARLLGASFTRYLFLLHLISVGSGCAGFLATYSSLVRRHWRLLAFCMSSAVVICASLVTSAAHERDFLTYEMVLFLTGTGAFLPCEPAWQWGFTAVTLGAYAPAAGLNLSDLPAVVGWLTLLTSAGIGHVAVTLNRGNWRRIAQMFDKLKQEGARRETAIAELERTHSQLAQSETKLRRVFEASQDTVCINSMVDGRYIDISKDSLLGGDLGYQRDEALGSTSRVLRVWASEEQRERFSSQLRRDGAREQLRGRLPPQRRDRPCVRRLGIDRGARRRAVRAQRHQRHQQTQADRARADRRARSGARRHRAPSRNSSPACRTRSAPR